MPTDENIAEDLEWTRGLRSQAILDRNSASRHTRAAVKRAAEKGWSKTRIAELAGISRQTVHEMLKED